LCASSYFKTGPAMTLHALVAVYWVVTAALLVLSSPGSSASSNPCPQAADSATADIITTRQVARRIEANLRRIRHRREEAPGRIEQTGR